MTATIHRPASQELQSRLLKLWERTNDSALQRLADGKAPFAGGSMATEQDRSDWVSTGLMNTFRQHGDGEVFALLYELNHASFLQAIKSYLHRANTGIDADDVLQEAFLNIYRYPHRFHADRADAFRCWGHSIVRNTVAKLVKGKARLPAQMTIDVDVDEPEDQCAPQPERIASQHESAQLVDQAYILFLGLYLQHFERLSRKEQRLLTLAEIECRCYRDIANECDIRPTHVKVAIFRCRRRIYCGMVASLAALGA
jgi:RNA polymerase sigma factor (sigma-70 family)